MHMIFADIIYMNENFLICNRGMEIIITKDMYTEFIYIWVTEEDKQQNLLQHSSSTTSNQSWTLVQCYSL